MFIYRQLLKRNLHFIAEEMPEFLDGIELVPDEPASTGGKEHERIETKNNRKRN